LLPLHSLLPDTLRVSIFVHALQLCVHFHQLICLCLVCWWLPVAVLVASCRGWSLNYVINTHHHFDHTGGNLELKKQFEGLQVG
jgi:hypothetical protein